MSAPHKPDSGVSSVPAFLELFVQDDPREALAGLLTYIRERDQAQDYPRRNQAVMTAVWAAAQIGYQAGYGYDTASGRGTDGFRIVAYIELPSGQVSWHLPEYPDYWDGHTTWQKYNRVATYADLVGRTEKPATEGGDWQSLPACPCQCCPATACDPGEPLGPGICGEDCPCRRTEVPS